MCRGASVSQSNNACAYLELTGCCTAGLSRGFADAGCAGAHLRAGHEAGAEGQARPPGLCHAGHPAYVPPGRAEQSWIAEHGNSDRSLGIIKHHCRLVLP